VKAVVFDGAIPRYLLTRALGAASRHALTGALRCTRYRDVPAPEFPGDRWVRIRTLLGGVCGSDLNLVSLNASPSTSPFSSFPFVVGHENVGVVRETGKAVTGVRPGDRVVVNPLLGCVPRGIDPPCRNCVQGHLSRCEHFTDGGLPPGMMIGTTHGLGGSWGEEFVAHESQVFTVPSGVTDRAAVLAEPLACVISPLLEHPELHDSRALVIGAGSMGLLATAALKAVARANVTVLSRHRFQSDHAERLGADGVVSSRSPERLRELSLASGGRLLQPILGPPIHVGGFDVTVVCVGSNTAVQDALRFTRSGGTILLLANVSALKRVDWTPVWIKELSIHGSLCYSATAHAGARAGAFETSMSLIAGPLGRELEPLVTHVVPLRDFRRALSLAWGRAGSGAVKVALSAPA
jgi:threonine dehydrogenase-like Zn-dependent dehydrogenase